MYHVLSCDDNSLNVYNCAAAAAAYSMGYCIRRIYRHVQNSVPVRLRPLLSYTQT